MTARPAISLHIEELVLHGATPADRHRIRDAVVRELIGLLEEGTVTQAITTDGAMPRVDGGVHRIAATASAAAIGSQIARAVYEGLGR